MEVNKDAKFKIVGHKLVLNAQGSLGYDGDNDGNPVILTKLTSETELDIPELMKEIQKSTSSTLLKAILPAAEAIVEKALEANNTPEG